MQIRNARRGALILSSYLIAIGLLAVGSRLVSAQTTDVAARLHRQVEAIAAGKDSSERAAAITKQLDAMEVPYQMQQFEKRSRRGSNIIAELPGTASKTLMLGAHLDRVGVGHGVVDNAASCAMLLELLPRLKKEPLKNFSLRVAFFDQEEAGLLGSQAYVEAARSEEGDAQAERGPKLPDAFINFDVFAYGDTLWVMSPKEDAPLAEAAGETGRETKFAVRVGSAYPPSDHLSFIRAGVPTISVSLIDGAEIDGVIQLIKGGGGPPGKRPRVFEIIHTPNDTMDKLDSEAVRKALPIVEHVIRRFDQRHTEQ
jgi:Zn-dependent M28 family amino/carboxypeptidase